MTNQKKIGFMQIFLQLLTAILLVALIILAWSISNWFESLSEQNYAEIKTTQPSNFGNGANTSPPPNTESVIEKRIIEITDQRLDMPENIGSLDTPTPGSMKNNIDNAQTKHSQRNSETDMVASAVDTQGTESQLTVEEMTVEAPTTNLEKLGSMVLESLGASMSQTKEDTDYLQALGEQFRDREQKTETLSEEQLAELVNHELEGLVDNRNREDIHNKVYVSSIEDSDSVSGDVDESDLQKKVETLVLSSLQKLVKEQFVSSPSKPYLESLDKEVETRINEMRIVVVRPGDSLSKIALRAYGDMHLYMKIFKANPHLGSDPNLIHVGQVLRVPI